MRGVKEISPAPGAARADHLIASDLSAIDSVHMNDFRPNELQTLYGGLPLPELSLSGEWKEQLDSSDIPVALHELAHVGTALANGINVKEASVIPDYSAGYRGITILEVPPSYNGPELQVISAAGSYWSTEGNESDVARHKISGSESFGQSLAKAKGFIETITKDEWKIMAQIFAHKRTIKGTDFPEMLRRARYELSIGITPDEKLFAQSVRRVQQEIQTFGAIQIIEDELVEEDLGDGRKVRYHRINGSDDESSREIVCAHCDRKFGHIKGCTMEKESSGEEQEVFSGKKKNLPKTGDIF